MTCSILGLIFNGYFYVFHLLHIIVGNDVRSSHTITHIALLSLSKPLSMFLYPFFFHDSFPSINCDWFGMMNLC